MDPINTQPHRGFDAIREHLADCATVLGTDEDCDCNDRHPERGTPGWCDLCSPDVCTCPYDSDAHPDEAEYDCDRY